MRRRGAREGLARCGSFGTVPVGREVVVEGAVLLDDEDHVLDRILPRHYDARAASRDSTLADLAAGALRPAPRPDHEPDDGDHANEREGKGRAPPHHLLMAGPAGPSRAKDGAGGLRHGGRKFTRHLRRQERV